jgi:hypothetical protein
MPVEHVEVQPVGGVHELVLAAGIRAGVEEGAGELAVVPTAVFFTQIVGLSAAQVGLGLTYAGIAAFLAALPTGKLVDRFGPKRMWALSATGQAAMFAVRPFITTFHGYVAMAVGMEVIGAPPPSAGCREPPTTTAARPTARVKIPGPGPLRNPGWLLTPTTPSAGSRSPWSGWATSP